MPSQMIDTMDTPINQWMRFSGWARLTSQKDMTIVNTSDASVTMAYIYFTSIPLSPVPAGANLKLTGYRNAAKRHAGRTCFNPAIKYQNIIAGRKGEISWRPSGISRGRSMNAVALAIKWFFSVLTTPVRRAVLKSRFRCSSGLDSGA